MTYREWEYDLKRLLCDLPQAEVEGVLQFYREIYSDKRDAGIPESEIVFEFGSPRECARRIYSESAYGDNIKRGERAVGADYGRKAPHVEAKPRVSGSGVSKIIGLVLLTLIVYIPIFSALFGLVAGFAAACISGGASVIAGIGGVLLGFFEIFASSLTEGLMLMGMGLGAMGAGIFLAVVFFYATKYTSIGLFKAFKALIFK